MAIFKALFSINCFAIMFTLGLANPKDYGPAQYQINSCGYNNIIYNLNGIWDHNIKLASSHIIIYA